MSTALDLVNSLSPIPYVKGFLDVREADDLFNFFRAMSVTPEPNKRNPTGPPVRILKYGTYVREPLSRTKAVYGPVLDFANVPEAMLSPLAKLSAYAGRTINYASVLGYRDERDHINFHQHPEDRVETDMSVYVLSLGHDRDLVLRPVGCKDKDQYVTIVPEHGSLYVLPSGYNVTHEHAIPDSKYPCGLRISINCKCEAPPDPKNRKVVKPFVRESGPPRIYNASGRFPDGAVYAGRGGTFKGGTFPPSPFGNYAKHNLKTAQGQVAWAVEVTAKMSDPAFRLQVEALRGRDLICHCSPKEINAGECHACTWLALANGVEALGECEGCGNAPATVRNERGENYCAPCAPADKEYARKQLVREMGVAKVIGKKCSLKSLVDLGGKTMDLGDGEIYTYPTVGDYLARLKEKFLGNPKYDQAVVVEHVARLEKKTEPAKALAATARTKLKKPVYKEGVDFDPAFLTTTQADELFELMKSQPFADNRVSYGPQVFPSPRKSNAWKDRYALATNLQPEPAAIRSLRLRLSERYGVPFNSVQCNWHDGNSQVKAHYDPYRVIAMVRLGAKRTFEVGDQRRNGGRNFKPYPMPHGSLITFLSGGLAHRMFPDPAAGDCVSLVFRLVTPPQTVASWHDKPTYGKTRAAHRKLYDTAVSEYRAALTSRNGGVR
jgi:alkylated DNA repair dioxygenase AlkB